jgi:hypothetical protein
VLLLAWLIERELARLTGQHTGRHCVIATACAALMGLSYAFWYYAVEVEVYTIAAIFLVIALAFLLDLARAADWRTALALGIVQGIAVLFHQTNVLLGVTALVALMFGSQGQVWRERGRLLVAYGTPLALIVGGAYLWAGLGISGFRRWDDLFGWAAGYATTGWWGGAIDQNKLELLVTGLTLTLAATGGIVLGVVLLGLFAGHWRTVRALPAGLIAIVLSWLVVYGAFFLWWEPDNIEFWIASLPPALLLLGLAVGTNRTAAHPWLAPGIMGGLGVVLLLINGSTIVQRGDATQDLQRVIAQATAALTQPDDLIIAADGLQELYLPYYEGRNQVISLNQAMTATNQDWAAACDWLQQRITAALEGGYAIVFTADGLRSPAAPPGEPPTPIERFGLSADAVYACYVPFLGMADDAPLGAELPMAQRIPAVSEVAAGAGWDFARGNWGWRLSNGTPVSDEIAPMPGWHFVPALDPGLISPPVTLDPNRIQAIGVRMATTTATRDGQLFLLDAAGQATEARSIRFTLTESGAMETYMLELDPAVVGSAPITGLRLDPVGAGDGGTVSVERVWVVGR